MKNFIKNLAVLFLFSSLGFVGLIEFNHQLLQPIFKKKVSGANLSFHKKNIHFCTNKKEEAIQDEKRIYIISPNSESFFYIMDDVFLRSHDVNGHRINQSNLSNYKEQESKEIWVFGDSYTYGFIGDNTETIPSFLSILNNENINFKNFAVIGYGSFNSLISFKWALNHYKDALPEKVIFIAHTNDLWDDKRTKKRLDAKANITEDFYFRKKIKYYFKQNRYLRSITNYYRSRRNSLFLTIKSFGKSNQKTYINNFDSSLTEQSLIEFLEIAKNLKIDPYLFLIPGRFLNERNEYTNDYFGSKIYNDLLLKISREKNVPYTNINDDLLEKNIKSTKKYKSVDDLYAIDGHYSEYGNFIAAKAIANSLMKNSKLNFKLNSPFENRTKNILGKEQCPN